MQYNVYTAELAALQLAIEILRDYHERTEWRIFTDSQAAIKAINNPYRQSGQAIINDFLDCIDDIKDKYPHLRIKIIWIPGHAMIDGNERADAEAKKVAIHPTSQPYNHRPLKSARIRAIKEAAKKQWDKQ
jgi:ribonuclease HI